LVWPESIFCYRNQFSDSIQPGLKILAGERIRMRDYVDFRSIGLQQANILNGRLGVDHANEFQAEVGACLCQADPHVARARFYYPGIACNNACLESPPQNVESRPVFHAPARIESFEFCKQPEV